jgi:hypothetical protein
MRTHRVALAGWTIALLFSMLLVLSDCANSASATATNTPTPSVLPSPTATSAPTQCAQLPGFANAGPATAGSGFGDVPFLGNSISTAITASGGGDGRYTIRQFDVCSPSTSDSAVHALYASGMPSSSWSQVATFPYDGGVQASCGDPYCWTKDKTPRFASLEKVTPHANGLVTYHLRLAVPPTPPSCMPDSIGIYATRSYDVTLPDTQNVPAPPLTKDGLGDGFQKGNVSRESYVGECSAGSGASINSFFNTELAKAGWSYSTPPSALASACTTSGKQWWKGKTIFGWSLNGSAGASGTFWQFGYCTVS